MPEEIYTEKDILNDALTAEKTATNNFNTYANECPHKNLREIMLDLLEKEHSIQNDVFQMMHEKGMYPTPAAEEKKIAEARQKYSCGLK